MSAEQAKTLSVPQAGRIYYGAGRNLSYELVRRGLIPVINTAPTKTGPPRFRVPVVAMEQRLLEACQESEKVWRE